MALLENRYKYSRKNIALSLVSILYSFRKAAVIIVLFLVSVLIFTFESRLSLRSASIEITGRISDSCINILDYLNITYLNVTNYFRTLDQLRNENKELESKLDSLQNIEQKLTKLQQEYNSIKQLIRFIDDSEYNSITARLIAVYSNAYNMSALISAGMNHGVRLDNIVCNGNSLIGKVIDVGPNYAKVMLMADPNLRVPVISTLSNERAIIAGNGKNNNSIQILYLDENATVEPGEIFVTSGDGIHYPYGISVARVVSVDQNGQINLVPCANIYNTGIVQVMLSNNIN